MNKLYLYFGLPGSGKTTHYTQKLSRNVNVDVYINADVIAEKYLDYDINDPGKTIKRAIKTAEEYLNAAIAEKTKNIVFDGGGINKNYTNRIISKALEANYQVEMIFIDTPLHECLRRNSLRDRKVPNNFIAEKEIKKLGTWWNYQEVYRGKIKFTKVNFFTKTHMFFDMDGVLAAQINLPRDEKGDIDFTNANYFEHLPPVIQVVNHVKRYFGSFYEIYILSAAPNSIAAKEKMRWLQRVLPDLKKENVFFVNSGQYKAEMFHNLVTYLKLKKEDMCLIEDTMSIINEVRHKYHMDAIHVSEFLTYNPFNYGE